MDDPTDAPAFLKVLTSGSSGNCSVLLRNRRFWLIDAGLSPRRLRVLLAAAGLTLDLLDGVLITHLDSDHWHQALGGVMPACVRFCIHAQHAEFGRGRGLLPPTIEPFTERISMDPGMDAAVAVGRHDELGTSSFRIACRTGTATASLGFATDIGRADPHLIEHLRDVDVLAIESNYCPDLQHRSARPWFLKSRITGGAGHLSNQQCAAAVRAIRPRSHVVLLHLSRQCNSPELARLEHPPGQYRLTLASQHQSTAWIPITPGLPRSAPIPDVPAPLFAMIAERAAPSHA
jgi:ribonuclease BN (tRNA processing enzyme)